MKVILRPVLILIQNYVHIHKCERGCGSLFSHLLGSCVSFQAMPIKIPHFYGQHSAFKFPYLYCRMFNYKKEKNQELQLVYEN